MFVVRLAEQGWRGTPCRRISWSSKMAERTECWRSHSRRPSSWTHYGNTFVNREPPWSTEAGGQFIQYRIHGGPEFRPLQRDNHIAKNSYVPSYVQTLALLAKLALLQFVSYYYSIGCFIKYCITIIINCTISSRSRFSILNKLIFKCPNGNRSLPSSPNSYRRRKAASILYSLLQW